MKRIVLFGVLASLLSFVSAAPWDALRPIANFSSTINPIVDWVVLVAALVLSGIAFLAYSKKNSEKLMFIFAGFGFFFLKALHNVVDLYLSPGFFMNLSILSIFDLLILASFAVAIFKK